MRPTSLGTYLRARRALVAPEQVGLPDTGRRRTPGLRREEVAALAGVSVDYYVRLEKGHDTNPSPQVLSALARALQLDPVATAYLLGLVDGHASGPVGRWRDEAVPESTRMLLEVIGLPAFVENRAFDVLAANAAATALSPAIVVGANRLRSMFLDDAERALHTDWEREAVVMVAEFRASVGAALADPHVAGLVTELSEAGTGPGAEFVRVWQRHDVEPVAGGPARWNHPVAGPLQLRRNNYTIGATDGQLLVVYHPASGSADARRLANLV
ncbi:hypothetical protein XF36_20785 [Pseudonocardia sp. HH130629-09]|nr:hypothetical protein XF36_20785 [Pseudonocardia sp. HH130629-09]